MSTDQLLEALHFAAQAHRDHRRKGIGAEPYINHLIETASLLSSVARVTDVDLLRAAVLHDTVEDTDVELADLEPRFGTRVRDLVEAVTDDTTLSSEERKGAQLFHLQGKSREVKLLKLADHCSNIASVPDSWKTDRRRRYLDWSKQVAELCAGVSEPLDAEYRMRWECSDHRCKSSSEGSAT